jgi:hypothetical protein
MPSSMAEKSAMFDVLLEQLRRQSGTKEGALVRKALKGMLGVGVKEKKFSARSVGRLLGVSRNRQTFGRFVFCVPTLSF